MKKIALFLVLIMTLGTAAFAAAPKKVPAPAVIKPPAAAPAPAPAPVTTSAPPKASSNMFSAVALTDNGCPLFRMPLGGLNLDLGGTVAQPVAGHTHITILARSEQPLFKVGNDIQLYWAPAGVFFSDNGTTFITANLLLGGEYAFASHLSLFADITAFTLTTGGGATAWSAITNNVQAYSGIRLYL